MKTHVLRFIQQETSATAVEYEPIAAGIAIAISDVVDGGGTTCTTMASSLE